jgi:hypothetical protein
MIIRIPKEIEMYRQGGEGSVRQVFEVAFAGLVFVAAAALVVGGAIAMCLPSGSA